MNIFALYKQELYHQVVICGSLCTEDLDFLCLCLSLVGLGRQRAAVILLRAKSESATEPSFKICLLSCLYEITSSKEFKLELEYWQSLGEFGTTALEGLKPFPQCHNGCEIDQIKKFSENGAFFHPDSFSFTCMNDAKAASEMIYSAQRESLLLQVVATCGSTTNIANVLKTEEMDSYFSTLEKKTQSTDISSEQPKNIIDNLKSLRNVSAIAAYHHILGNEFQALFFCTRAIQSINTLQMNQETCELVGVSHYEKETLLMIAAHSLSVNADEDFVESLLNELMNHVPQFREGDLILSISNCHIQEISSASALRQSYFFESCGHIHRVMAHKSSKEVTLSHQGGKYTGRIYSRHYMLEMTRKYVIASALQPIDNPYLMLYYDRVIWCLLLSGGVDLRVIFLFITIRNYYSHKKLLSLVDAQDQSMPMWPNFKHGLELLERIFDMCNDVLKAGTDDFRVLSPTTIDCGENVVILKSYIHDVHMQLDEPIDTEIMETNPPPTISDTESRLLMVSSQDMAEIWSSTYHKSQGTIPKEITWISEFFNI